MKTVYICSPYRGKDENEVTQHIHYAVELLEFALTAGVAPIVPHLYFPQVLDDCIESDREIALRCGRTFLRTVDMVIAGCRYGISDGMEEEIILAQRLGIPIIYIDAKPEKLVGIFDMMTIAETKALVEDKKTADALL